MVVELRDLQRERRYLITYGYDAIECICLLEGDACIRQVCQYLDAPTGYHFKTYFGRIDIIAIHDSFFLQYIDTRAKTDELDGAVLICFYF